VAVRKLVTGTEKTFAVVGRGKSKEYSLNPFAIVWC